MNDFLVANCKTFLNQVVNIVLLSVAVLVHIATAIFLEQTDWREPVYIRNQFIGVVFLLSCIQVTLRYLSYLNRCKKNIYDSSYQYFNAWSKIVFLILLPDFRLLEVSSSIWTMGNHYFKSYRRYNEVSCHSVTLWIWIYNVDHGSQPAIQGERWT